MIESSAQPEFRDGDINGLAPERQSARSPKRKWPHYRIVSVFHRRCEYFFLWNRHNPLKSPDSDEEIQGNPNHFPWSGLVWLGVSLV
jgi:hypothetical protein